MLVCRFPFCCFWSSPSSENTVTLGHRPCAPGMPFLFMHIYCLDTCCSFLPFLFLSYDFQILMLFLGPLLWLFLLVQFPDSVFCYPLLLSYSILQDSENTNALGPEPLLHRYAVSLDYTLLSLLGGFGKYQGAWALAFATPVFRFLCWVVY